MFSILDLQTFNHEFLPDFTASSGRFLP